MARLFTIGHGVQGFPQLVGNLEKHGVRVLVDVRSHPRSSRAPAFDRPGIAELLVEHGIHYVWAGDTLGGRPPGELRTNSGVPDYEAMATATATRKALDDLATAAEETIVVIMCSESNPDECHRTRMIEPELERRRVQVEHILPDGSTRFAPTLFA